jgi:hypothetical protein
MVYNLTNVYAGENEHFPREIKYIMSKGKVNDLCITVLTNVMIALNVSFPSLSLYIFRLILISIHADAGPDEELTHYRFHSPTVSCQP